VPLSLQGSLIGMGRSGSVPWQVGAGEVTSVTVVLRHMLSVYTTWHVPPQYPKAMPLGLVPVNAQLYRTVSA
jgi:hypothetical protein